MIRKIFKERENFADTHATMGFHYHNTPCPDGKPYWTEGVAYEFTLDEVEEIESVTADLHSMCLETVAKIVDSGDYPEEFGLNDTAKTLIESSWRKKAPHVYGRFDLCVNPDGSIKLFEYNADTPTSLLEAGVAQWQWLEQTEGVNDQFNSIHEKLIDRWIQVKGGQVNPTLHLFASRDGHYEDWGNVSYMADVAVQAGWNVNIDEMENIGYVAGTREFVDNGDISISHAFKLYAWEWMVTEEFGTHILTSNTNWYEPAWKMLLSNKAILAQLWSDFKNHPNLLPTFNTEQNGYVKKPTLGREGANVFLSDKLMDGSHMVAEYDSRYIYQQYSPLPNIDGYHPVIGSWVIGDEPAGMGIREDSTLISGNGSHFVPHYFND